MPLETRFTRSLNVSNNNDRNISGAQSYKRDSVTLSLFTLSYQSKDYLLMDL